MYVHCEFLKLQYCSYYFSPLFLVYFKNKRETHEQEIIVRHLVAQFLFWHYIVACGEGDGPHFRMTKHSHGVAGRRAVTTLAKTVAAEDRM